MPTQHYQGVSDMYAMHTNYTRFSAISFAASSSDAYDPENRWDFWEPFEYGPGTQDLVTWKSLKLRCSSCSCTYFTLLVS